jgi:hypothetical protein
MDSQTQLDIKRLWQHIYALEARVAQLEAGSVKTSAPPLSDSKPVPPTHKCAAIAS